MKSVLSHRNLFVELLCLAVLVMMGTAFARGIFPDVNYPAIEEPNHTTGREYAENEIIVKFHGNAAEAIEVGLAKSRRVSELKLSDSLDKLNNKYKLKKARPLFKNFKERRQEVKGLLSKDKALLSKKEKHILRRLKRAPKGVRVPDLSRIYKLELELEEGQSLKEVVEAYQRNPDVEYAELNYIISINLGPNDPCYSLQWPLNNTGQDYPASGRFNQPPGTPDSDIDAPEAWDVHTGSSKITVAVIDTGVDYNHRDLQSNMWVNEAELDGVVEDDDDGNGYIDDIYGYDFINNDADPKDDHGHGTHCSGIIAAEGDNGLDIAGVCWDGRIMALKFLGSGGSGYASDAVKAFYYAVENGADVTSNSWSAPSYSQTMKEAIDYAHSQGVIMISSAGNYNSDYPLYPAYYDHMIAVAATNSNDEKATFSSYGDWVDIAAPGVDILSLRANGTSMGKPYDYYTTIASGTSMACPHVAGACALLLSANPLLRCDEVYDILMETVDPISEGICLSDGRVNLSNAILAVVSSKGRIIFDHDYYACSSVVSLLLIDYELEGTDAHAIALTTSGGDSETVLLTEIVSAAGVFTGTILTDSADVITEDRILELSDGEIITATYEDANDGTGSSATATDTAVVDCEEPVIFNVHINVPGREPRVRFETNEPTTARILGGLACGGPYIIEGSDSSLSTSHAIKLTGVWPETDYFFIIEAADAAGNETVESNGGRCYTFTTTAAAGEIYVPSQCPTIQEAIDNSWDGGTVWVADGRYTGSGNRDIDFKGRSITVRGENGPENCIIDCNGTEAESHRGFYFHSGEDADSVLAGFTITNGYVSGSWYVGIGGAILCEYNSSPTITNCIVSGNSAGWDGGGINNLSSSPTITNCTFTGNSAVGNDGGGINNESSSPTITNCTFSGNSAYDWGGAIRNILYCRPTITNCTFRGNSADDGGAMFYFYESKPTITNCTFAGNSARNGNALACDSLGSQNNIQMANCILWDGGDEIWNNNGSAITITYSDVQGGWSGAGNIDADPMFDDYLGRLSAGSPCIDAGDNTAVSADTADLDNDGNTVEPIPWDLDGGCRFVDHPDTPDTGNGTPPIVDMGAYEFAPAIEVPMKFTPQALNHSSKGKWVKAHFVLPEGFAVEDVDANRPIRIRPLGIRSDYIDVFINDGLVEIKVGFDRSSFCAAVDYGPAEVTVIGLLSNCEYFYGTDTIRIISGNLKYLAVLSSYWLETACGTPDWCGGVDLDQDSVVNFVDFALFDGCCIEVVKDRIDDYGELN